VYGVHKLQMPLPGRYVSTGTLLQSYGAKNMVSTQKDQPLSSSKRWTHFQTYKMV
jgi:hypothetical protein